MLDVRTLIFAVVAANMICFVAIAVLYFGRVPVKGPLAWALAKLANSLGLVLLFLRGHAPDYLSIVLANGFLILGAVLEWYGIRQFLGIKRCGPAIKTFMWGAAPLVMAVIYWYSALDPLLWVRRALVSLVFTGISLLLTKDFFSHTPKTSAIKTAIVIYLSYATIMSINTVLSLVERPAIEQLFLATSLHNSLLFLYSMLSAILGTFVMILMVSQELQRRLEKQATLDPLTGAYNRLALQEFGRHAFARMQRSQKPFAALMIDLDHFKKINDEKGHAVGDKLLVHFVNLVNKTIRSEDLLFRYGGEEFVVLVPVAKRDGCIALAERIRSSCESNPLKDEKNAVGFSVSIGLALSQMDDRDIYEAINRADEAMYGAKSAGRNRVVFHDSECRKAYSLCAPETNLRLTKPI